MQSEEAREVVPLPPSWENKSDFINHFSFVVFILSVNVHSKLCESIREAETLPA